MKSLKKALKKLVSIPSTSKGSDRSQAKAAGKVAAKAKASKPSVSKGSAGKPVKQAPKPAGSAAKASAAKSLAAKASADRSSGAKVAAKVPVKAAAKAASRTAPKTEDTKAQAKPSEKPLGKAEIRAPGKSEMRPAAAPAKAAVKAEKVGVKEAAQPKVADVAGPRAAKNDKTHSPPSASPQPSILTRGGSGADTEDEEPVLTDAEGRRYCRVKDCDQAAVVEGYCRYHYLLLWKKIQVRKKILSEGKLERYIEELTARYPDKYLEMLRKDLKSEKDFMAAIQELELDESSMDGEYEDEGGGYIEEVRGMSDGGSVREDDDAF